jgi:hypothetical protein
VPSRHNVFYDGASSWKNMVRFFITSKGSENRVADALSRLPREETDPVSFPEKLSDIRCLPRVDSRFSMVTDDPDLLDCLVHLPVQQEAPFQMDFQTIAEAQLQDAALLQHAQSQPLRVQQRLLVPGTQVYCYVTTPGGPWKIHDARWSVEDLSSPTIYSRTQ